MPPCMAWWNPNVLCKDYWCFCILYVFLFVTGVGPTQAWETRGIISFTPNLPDPPCAKSSKTSVWTSLVRRAMTPPGRHVQPHQSDTSAENEHSFPYAFKSTGSYHYCSFIFVSLTEENGIALFSVAFFRIIRQHIFISYLCFFLCCWALNSVVLPCIMLGQAEESSCWSQCLPHEVARDGDLLLLDGLLVFGFNN